jgi:hypothetical protein
MVDPPMTLTKEYRTISVLDVFKFGLSMEEEGVIW